MGIPQYDSPKVQQAPLDAPRMGMGVPENPYSALGRGLDSMNRGFQEIQHEADQTVAMDAFLKLQEQSQGLVNGASQVRGKDVFNQTNPATGEKSDLHGGFLANFDDIAKGMEQGLKNPNQKRMFQQAAARLRLEAGGQVEGHQIRQVTEYQTETNKAGISMASNGASQAAALGDMDGVTNNLKQAEFFASAQAKLLGLDGPALQSHMLEASSAVHAGVIQTLISGDKPFQASEYFKAHKDQMLPDVRAKAENIISNQTSTMKANQLVDDVWKPEGNFEAQAKTIREKTANDPDTQRKALAFLDERRTDHLKSMHDSEVNLTGPLWEGILAGKGLRWMVAQPQYAQLSELGGDAKVQMFSKAESFLKRNMNQPESNDPVDIARRGFLFNELMQKFKAGALTKNDVFSNAGALGRQYTAALVDKIGDAQIAPPKVIKQIDINENILKSELRAAGIIGDKLSGKDQAIVGDLHAKLLERQAASGHQWDEKSTTDLVRLMVTPIITDPSTHWWTGDTKEPAFRAEQQVPQAFINEALRRNPNITRNELTQAYFLAKKKGLINPDGSMKVNQ